MQFTNISPKSVDYDVSSNKLVLLTLLAITCFTVTDLAQAEFVLNFQPETSRYEDPEWLNFNCNRPRASGGGFEDCDDNDEFRDNNGKDSTAFLMERVRDPNSGDQYYHTIIGLEGSDFVQEAYIKITRYFGNDDCNNGSCNPSSTPREVDDLGPISDSRGDWRDITEYRDNAYDPMGPSVFSGSGTANPKSTQFRQLMGGDGFSQDMTKAKFNTKHKLNQDLNAEAGKVIHSFELDMTNSTYDQDHIAGLMNKNYFKITGSGINGTSPIEFDITDSFYQDRGGFDISGGKYKFVKKYDETIGLPIALENEYIGAGGGYNIWNEDWKKYYDPSQNGPIDIPCTPDKDGKCDGNSSGLKRALYSGGDKDNQSQYYQPFSGGKTWASWSENRMSNN